MGKSRKLFGKLRMVAFGGSRLLYTNESEERIVNKPIGWISPKHFFDMVGATNLDSRPNPTEMAHAIAAIIEAVFAGLSLQDFSFISRPTNPYGDFKPYSTPNR